MTASAAVRVTYLGTAGFLMERGHDAVMTAPLYSNPAFGRVLAEEPLEVNRSARRLPQSSCGHGG